MENYQLMRKLNEIEHLLKWISNRMPDEESIEDMVKRLIQESNSLPNK